MTCKNCNSEVNSNYCPNCGQAANLKRINGHYLIHEIEHVLHLERGIFYTIKQLIINPGQSVKIYLTENRNKFVKPIIFIVVASLIYSICNSFFHFEDPYADKIDHGNSATLAISKWIQGHYGYANIIMAFFIALWTKLFFRKYKFNIFEILILLCFIMGIGMLILALFGIIQGLAHTNLILMAGFVCFIYTTWAIGQFFEKGKAVSYIKAFLAYFLGVLTFYITAIVIGTIIDLIIKH
jgi:hypothetical protein